MGPPGFEPGTSCGGLFVFSCALGLFEWFAVPHASVTFGSFSMVCLCACCWVFVVVGVSVLCLIHGAFLSLPITISLCMACVGFVP